MMMAWMITRKKKHRQAAQHTNVVEKAHRALFCRSLLKIQNFSEKISNLSKSILQNLKHLFKAFWHFEDQIPQLYIKNDRLNVTELLITIRISTKETNYPSVTLTRCFFITWVGIPRGCRFWVFRFCFSDSFQTSDSSLQILNLGFQIADLQLSMVRDFFSTTPMKLFSTTLSEMISTTQVG